MTLVVAGIPDRFFLGERVGFPGGPIPARVGFPADEVYGIVGQSTANSDDLQICFVPGLIVPFFGHLL